MGALKDLFASERGIIALALIIAVTVLAAIGIATFDDWQSYTKMIFLVYASAKTATGVAQIIKGTPDSTPAPDSTTVEQKTTIKTVTATPASGDEPKTIIIPSLNA